MNKLNIKPNSRYIFNINKISDLKHIKFYDMNHWTKEYDKLFDMAEGGFSFISGIWKESMLHLVHREEAIIETVKYLTIAGIYNYEYVYILEGTHNGVTRYKIGKAKSLKDRVKLFNVKIPFDIRVIASFRVENALMLESKLHQEFKDSRLSGEWFKLTSKDFSKIIDIGAKTELNDYWKSREHYSKKEMSKKWKNDKDYIEYLQSILVFNEIQFESRVY